MSYSEKQIDNAGLILRSKSSDRSDEEYLNAMDKMSYWRASHTEALQSAFTKIQNIALKEDRSIIFVKRLKRAPSIANKLKRIEKMTLRNMQDIGGCRAVFLSEKKLRKALRQIKSFPEFKWEDSRHRLKDYIKEPQASVFRSVHVIGPATRIYSGRAGQPHLPLGIRQPIRRLITRAGLPVHVLRK